ncbi:MAG: hypothetical protein J3K34DRAFT_527469 [Monoraphidium minutum]|nr:MAG: hypothetical protein J3K34DRAFT_527469 [Monoraphidium minutum]
MGGGSASRGMWRPPGARGKVFAWLLFLDGDEVPDGRRVAEWAAARLPARPEGPPRCLKLAAHWYFREPTNRADAWEDSVVLADARAFAPAAGAAAGADAAAATAAWARLLMVDDERDGLARALAPGGRMVAGLDGAPMFHHFSWVRTKQQLLRKVATWGHRGDKDWAALIEAEFERPAGGRDFVHGYTYTRVPNAFGIVL